MLADLPIMTNKDSQNIHSHFLFYDFSEDRVVVQSSLSRYIQANSKESDYDVIQEDDIFEIKDLTSFAPKVSLTLVANHSDGSIDEIIVNHTFNGNQIKWFKAGSALNLISQQSDVNA